jgi:hypothetical protein
MAHMKTTVEIDEKKLNRVMKLTGLKTMKEAIDFALAEAERVVRLKNILSGSFYIEESGDVIYPEYDIVQMRELENPGHASR